MLAIVFRMISCIIFILIMNLVRNNYYSIMPKYAHRMACFLMAALFLILVQNASSLAITQSETSFSNIISRHHDHVTKNEAIKLIIQENDLREKGESQITAALTPQNMTIYESDLWSNMIITDKYALVGKYNRFLTGVLKKLNFETMKLQTIHYQRKYFTQTGSYLTLGNPKNGYFLVGDGQYLYILDNETLTLKQTLKGNESVSDIITNPNEAVCFIRRGSYDYYNLYQLIIDNQTNKFVQILRTYDNWAPFVTFLTGGNTAVTINATSGCEVSYWDNIKPVVELSYNRKDYMLQRLKVAVSYSETFFVLKNQQNYLYEFYTLDSNIQISLSYSILIDNYNHKKGALTNDDSTLFVSTSKSETKDYIAKVDILSKDIKFLTDEQGNFDNQLDFNLFDSKYNQVVTLSTRNQANQTHHYLQLWSTYTLRILDEYLLQFGFDVLSFKLVGSIQWDLTFALTTKISKQRIQNDSLIHLFTIKSGKIINLNLRAQVTDQFIQACYRYVVSYKKDNQYMKVLYFSNLTVAKIIYSKLINDNGIIIQKNVMTLTQSFGQCSIYNFEKSLQSQGVVHKESQRRIFDNFVSILFPKKSIIYQSSTKQYSNNEVTKAVYNISVSPVRKTFKIDGELPCLAPKYYFPHQTTAKGQKQCNYIFYVQKDEDHKLVRYSECTNQLDKFLIIQKNIGRYVSLHISSDNRYLIILDYLFPTPDLLLLQIRLISNLSHIIYQQITSQKDVLVVTNWYNADLINDTMIVLHSTQYMKVIYIQPQNHHVSDQANIVEEKPQQIQDGKAV